MDSYYKTDAGFFKFNTIFSFTLGIFGKALNKVNYSKELTTIRNEEIALLSDSLKIEKRNIIMLNQVHGDSIMVFNNPLPNGDRTFPEADGMITNIDKLCLVIRSADCVPVFAFDIKNKVLGAVHSGWRGCRLNISGNLIRKMKSVFKSMERDLHIYILPSIGPESYTVNSDVASLLKNDIIIKNNKIYLNLWENIKRSLIEEKIPESNIHQSGTCTYLNNYDYFSNRYGDSGRNLNFGFINN